MVKDVQPDCSWDSGYAPAPWWSGPGARAATYLQDRRHDGRVEAVVALDDLTTGDCGDPGTPGTEGLLTACAVLGEPMSGFLPASHRAGVHLPTIGVESDDFRSTCPS